MRNKSFEAGARASDRLVVGRAGSLGCVCDVVDGWWDLRAEQINCIADWDCVSRVNG